MAQTKLNVVFKEIRNNVDGLVFYTRNGKTCCRTYSRPSDPKSERQKAVRNAFQKLAGDWKTMDSLMRSGWESVARKRKISGYNAYLGENAAAQRNGAPIALSLEFGENPVASFEAATGKKPGTVILNFDADSIAEGRHLAVFVQKISGGKAEGPLLRREFGAGARTGVIMSGLDAGGDYHLYAVVTDAPYAEAKTCSASVASRAKAGE